MTRPHQRPPGRLRRAYAAIRIAAGAYGRHGASQHAAAIAYRALFALVPLVLLLVSVIDAALPEHDRQRMTNWVFTTLTIPTDLEQSIHRALSGPSPATPIAAVLGVVGLLWTASGIMGSIRMALAVVWGERNAPSFPRAKVRDIVLVVGSGLIAIAAFALTLLAQAVNAVGDRVRDALGLTAGTQAFGTLTQFGASVLATFIAFAAIYRLATSVRPPWTSLWRGALVGAVAFQLATAAYAAYLARFSDISVVYGSLAALLGFLLVLYAGASAFLLGAELVAGWWLVDADGTEGASP